MANLRQQHLAPLNTLAVLTLRGSTSMYNYRLLVIFNTRCLAPRHLLFSLLAPSSSSIYAAWLLVIFYLHLFTLQFLYVQFVSPRRCVLNHYLPSSPSTSRINLFIGLFKNLSWLSLEEEHLTCTERTSPFLSTMVLVTNAIGHLFRV